MKLAHVIPSFVIVVATVTGCAASTEEPQDPQTTAAKEETPATTDPAKDQQRANDTKAPAVEESPVAPTAMCTVWYYVNGTRYCRF